MSPVNEKNSWISLSLARSETCPTCTVLVWPWPKEKTHKSSKANYTKKSNEQTDLSTKELDERAPPALRNPEIIMSPFELFSIRVICIIWSRRRKRDWIEADEEEYNKWRGTSLKVEEKKRMWAGECIILTVWWSINLYYNLTPRFSPEISSLYISIYSSSIYLLCFLFSIKVFGDDEGDSVILF